MQLRLGEVLSKASKHLSIRYDIIPELGCLLCLPGDCSMPTITYRSNKKNRPILEAWRDIDSFLLLDDSVEDVIMLDMKLNPPKNVSIYLISGLTSV